MSLKTGCFQDLSIGGITVWMVTHQQFVELQRCRYQRLSNKGEPKWTVPQEPMDTWSALKECQEEKYTDRRVDP